MTVQTNYLENGIGVEFISSGIVTGEEIIEANIKLYRQDNLRRMKYKIIDRTYCTDYQVTKSDIKFIANQDTYASRINPNITVIFISPTALQYGMTRMWQTFVDETGFQIELFEDRKSADAYIKEHFQQSYDGTESDNY